MTTYQRYSQTYRRNYELHKQIINNCDMDDIFFYERVEIEYATILKIRENMSEDASIEDIITMDELIADYKKLLSTLNTSKKEIFVEPTLNDVLTPIKERFAQIKEMLENGNEDLSTIKNNAEELVSEALNAKLTFISNKDLTSNLTNILIDIRDLINEIEDKIITENNAKI